MFAESVSYPAAFLAGLLSFLSPCLLPLLPAYFTFITGVTLDDLSRAKGLQVRGRIVGATLGYVLGFSTIFILMGASASLLGGVVRDYDYIIRVAGGLLIILFGLHLTGWLPINLLNTEKRIQANRKPVHFLGTYFVGMAFAAGWTPCIGPLLGSILIIAGQQDTIREGVILLSLYSLGIALPFMLIAVFIHYLLNLIKGIRRHILLINRTAGILLILTGGALILDRLALP